MFGAYLSLLDLLGGCWTLARRIDDRLTGLNGSFEGTATFRPAAAPEMLDYHETGTLSYGALRHNAERVYLWHCEAPDRALVSFADGRPFHVVAPKGGIAEADHLCGSDHYSGRYVFETSDRWHLTWRVKGPRKDYTMDSTYTRQ